MWNKVGKSSAFGPKIEFMKSLSFFHQHPKTRRKNTKTHRTAIKMLTNTENRKGGPTPSLRNHVEEQKSPFVWYRDR